MSKDSDIGVIMIVYEDIFLYLFQTYLRKMERVVQTNIIEKYYTIGRFKLLLWHLRSG